MKQTSKATDATQGLRQAITVAAVAATLAGWAVLARAETPAAASVASAPAAAQASAAPAQPALRVVNTSPAPVTVTQSSR